MVQKKQFPLSMIALKTVFAYARNYSIGQKTLNSIKRAQGNNYFIRLYYVGLDTAQESLPRIENRVKKVDTILIPMPLLNGLTSVLTIYLPCCPTATRLLFTITTTGL